MRGENYVYIREVQNLEAFPVLGALNKFEISSNAGGWDCKK